MDFILYPSETQFLGFIRANYLALFPRLIDQSQFNRRASALRLLVEELRWAWPVQLGVFHHARFLLDTKPVPVVVSNAAMAVAISPGAPAMVTVPVVT